MRNATLQVLIILGPEPVPESVTGMALKLRVQPMWLLDGTPQEVSEKDRATVISMLQQALHLSIAGAQFDPPKILVAVGAPPAPPGH